MKIVKNAKRIALKSYSMWSMYLGVLLLVIPEVLFVVWELEVDPYCLWNIALLLLVVGAVGRLVDQGMNS